MNFIPDYFVYVSFKGFHHLFLLLTPELDLEKRTEYCWQHYALSSYPF